MLKYIYNILSFLLLLQIVGLNQSIAQVKVQVVSQKITESIEWKEGITLEVNGERAEIYCTSHPSNTIDIEVKFIAKHENKLIAESDLKKMRWINETLNNKVFLRNYIELSRSETKPESDIKTIYHIKVPRMCKVEIRNYFGKIKVENLGFKLKINSEFCPVELIDIHGKANIKSTFGDISANGIQGDFYIESNRSDIQLSDISGTLELHSILAEIILNGFNKIEGIKIDAEKSKVNIEANDLNSFSIFLELINAKLDKPEVVKFDFTKNDNDEVKASLNSLEDFPQMAIKLNVGSLIIDE